jgi:uncharacterized protein with PIN domain
MEKWFGRMTDIKRYSKMKCRDCKKRVPKDDHVEIQVMQGKKILTSFPVCHECAKVYIAFRLLEEEIGLENLKKLVDRIINDN